MGKIAGREFNRIREILAMNVKAEYFFRVLFAIDRNWYNNTREAINVTFHFAPKEIIKKYEIEQDETVNNKLQFLVKVHSNVTKKEFAQWLKSSTTRAEEFKVL